MNVRIRLTAGIAFALLALGAAPWHSSLVAPIAEAQVAGQRVVTGVVQNEAGPVTGATVFLRNTKTKAIRSYTSTKDGHFRFAQVNMSDDFDLWAEKGGEKSPTKQVSSWDTRKEVHFDLHLK